MKLSRLVRYQIIPIKSICLLFIGDHFFFIFLYLHNFASPWIDNTHYFVFLYKITSNQCKLRHHCHILIVYQRKFSSHGQIVLKCYNIVIFARTNYIFMYFSCFNFTFPNRSQNKIFLLSKSNNYSARAISCSKVDTDWPFLFVTSHT